MTTFTIEKETNNITAHATAQAAESVAGAERFATAAALAQVAAHWPAARLVEIWNSLPGAPQVTKFKDRKTAATRIWKALQTLGNQAPTRAEPKPRVARVKAEPVRKPTPSKPAPKNKATRQGSKTGTILDLLKRPGGASLTEIMKATGWQAHSVRGFVSGTLGKKMGLTVVSTKIADSDRSYSIQA